MTLATIRRWLRPWLLHREKLNWLRRPSAAAVLASAIPGYPGEDDFAACRKGHKAGVRQLRKDRGQAIHLALAGGKPRVRVQAGRRDPSDQEFQSTAGLAL